MLTDVEETYILHHFRIKIYITSLVLVHFSLSRRFLSDFSRKNAIYVELNVSRLDEVVPRQTEFKGEGFKISI